MGGIGCTLVESEYVCRDVSSAFLAWTLCMLQKVVPRLFSWV